MHSFSEFILCTYALELGLSAWNYNEEQRLNHTRQKKSPNGVFNQQPQLQILLSQPLEEVNMSHYATGQQETENLFFFFEVSPSSEPENLAASLSAGIFRQALTIRFFLRGLSAMPQTLLIAQSAMPHAELPHRVQL